MKKILGQPITIRNWELKIASFFQEQNEAFCLYKGDYEDFKVSDVLVRIHSACLTSEVFEMQTCDCKWQLNYGIDLIGESKAGILIYLPYQEGKGNGLFNKIQSLELMKSGLSSSDSYQALGLPADNREYGFAIQILKEFGVKRVKLITNSPAKVMACVDGGILISERIPAIINNPNKNVLQLLKEKKRDFNHFIEL